MKVGVVYLNDLLDKLKKIDDKNYANPKDKDGDIGERFVKDSIKYYMWEKGFNLRDTGNRTFKIEHPPKKGQEGADFPFSFTFNSIVYDCFIESKNWGEYQYITNSTFNDEILERFTKKANQQGCIWIITMNTANISHINNRCQQHDIRIIPIDKKITSVELNIESLKPIMENFLDEFHDLMTSLTRVNLHKTKNKLKTDSKRYDKAIIQGLPSDLIAKTYNTTKKNIEKRRSELRSQGENILDWRSKTARRARLIIKDQLDEDDLLIDMMISILKEKERK